MTAKPMERADLPEHQRLLLDTIEDICGSLFDHSLDNMREIRTAMGWNDARLRQEMRELTLKGFLQRELREYGKPRRWAIVNRNLIYRQPSPAGATA